MTRLILPYPTSVNRLYRVGVGGNVYKDDDHSFGWAVKAAAHEANLPLNTSGDVAVSVWVYVKTRRADIDNRLKHLLDSLNGVAYADDSQIVELHVYKRFEGRAKARIELEVYAV